MMDLGFLREMYDGESESEEEDLLSQEDMFGFDEFPEFENSFDESLEFGDDFDDMDAAFLLGFVDEMGMENDVDPEEGEGYAPEYIPLKNPHQRAATVHFESKVQQFIEDLQSGKKKMGDKL